MIKALNDFIQKAGNEEALGDRNWNTASAKIEEFVLIDLTGCCAVSATDVIRENFEARH
jgi:hypothetical protein